MASLQELIEFGFVVVSAVAFVVVVVGFESVLAGSAALGIVALDIVALAVEQSYRMLAVALVGS